jgi:hypothetical protein
VTHALEQERLGAREHVEARLRVRVEERLRVVPVAAAVLDPGDHFGERAPQAFAYALCRRRSTP